MSSIRMKEELEAKQQELLAGREGKASSKEEKQQALIKAYRSLAIKYYHNKITIVQTMTTFKNALDLRAAYKNHCDGGQDVPETTFTTLSYSSLFFAVIKRVFISVFGEERLSDDFYEKAFYEDNVSPTITKRKLMNPFKWVLFLAELLTACLWFLLYSLVKITEDRVGAYWPVFFIIPLFFLPFTVMATFGAATLVAGVLRVICSPVNHGWLPAKEFIQNHLYWSLLLGVLTLATGFVALSLLTAGAVPAFLSFMAPAMTTTAHALTSLSSLLLPVLPVVPETMCAAAISTGIFACIERDNPEIFSSLFQVMTLFILAGLCFPAATPFALGVNLAFSIAILSVQEKLNFFCEFSLKSDGHEAREYTEISRCLYNTPTTAKVISEEVRDRASFQISSFFGVLPKNVGAPMPDAEPGALAPPVPKGPGRL